MIAGKRHKLRCRRSIGTGRLLVVLEHEIDCDRNARPEDLTPEQLEILAMTIIGQRETAAKDLIEKLQKQVADLTAAAQNSTPFDADDKAAATALQATLDAANPPATATPADTLAGANGA